MSSARRQVLLSKVLTRLYPNVADPQSASLKNESLQPEEPKEPIQPSLPEPADIEKSNISPLKVYTASLPPDGYIPPQTDLRPSTTEDSDLEEDQPAETCKRRRRKKRKVNSKNESTSDRQQHIQKTPQSLEGGKINKNKKRKLQRKRQKARLKAEGKWTKGGARQSDMCQKEDQTRKQADEHTKEEERKKREDLLDFLQSTEELYFSDSKTRCADSALMVEQILEILDQIKSGAVLFSEVQLLHHLKSLLLLQDIERLNESLGSFKEQSSMPPDYIKALCFLFDYWITNILPIKTNPTK
ncbi:glutamate-rich protein 1 isoform 2-T2 [Anomaloglossus baeobatrachus]|uniref:glutamate-rich protein 1 isoform X1 n=1 Tax=Anomaloglossus baeobatrachus TaxID=238106 RepID=UPI003F4F6DD1